MTRRRRRCNCQLVFASEREIQQHFEDAITVPREVGRALGLATEPAPPQPQPSLREPLPWLETAEQSLDDFVMPLLRLIFQDRRL